MTIDSVTLNDVQDRVFADKSLWPKEDANDEETFCNIAALRVANGVGCHAFDPPAKVEPLMADQIYNLLKTASDFTRQPMQDCQEIMNKGALIFAILPSWFLHQHSGHVCTLTTGVGDHSGRWDKFTPFCMNLGRQGTCFRRKGVNWAFQVVPEFYLWTTS